LYLTIEYQHIIYLYTVGGDYKKHFGKTRSGNEDGEFDQPRGMTCDSKDLFICDGLNDRIQVLDKEDGQYQTQFGFSGSVEGSFDTPFSIYLLNGTELDGNDDRLYIGDTKSIQIFTKDGKCTQRLGDKENGNQKGQFDYIRGICIYKEKLYICDFENSRIQVFRQKQSTLKEGYD